MYPLNHYTNLVIHTLTTYYINVYIPYLPTHAHLNKLNWESLGYYKIGWIINIKLINKMVCYIEMRSVSAGWFWVFFFVSFFFLKFGMRNLVRSTCWMVIFFCVYFRCMRVGVEHATFVERVFFFRPISLVPCGIDQGVV